jgi:hypothetical protein
VVDQVDQLDPEPDLAAQRPQVLEQPGSRRWQQTGSPG